MCYFPNCAKTITAKEVALDLIHPEIQICVLPGGRMPQRQSEGAVGYDAHIRAVVDSFKMDEKHPQLRKTIFDFERYPESKELYDFLPPQNYVHMIKKEDGSGTELAWCLYPGKSVLVGIGFATAMPQGLFYWVAPRSGLAARYRITVTNAPGTVDPDYRGEAGALVHNIGQAPFSLRKGMRIVQVLFQWAVFPQMQVVQDLADLSDTRRGAGGFGSTGI